MASDAPPAAGMTTPARPVPPPGVVAQRCVLVLPSTAEFDSRTYRIARTLHERGHEVTVLARWRPGLAHRERHAVGYPIIRVDVTASDLPGIGGLRRVTAGAAGLVARLRGRHGAGHASPPVEAAGSGASDESMAPGWAHPAPDPHAGRLGAYLRRARIFSMIRDHRRAALEVGPPADVYHGMAYMGVPVALTLARRHRARSVYDSRDIYMVAANLARLRGPVKWLLARLERGWARAVDRVITVNVPYATELGRRFGVATPVVVMNCSYRYTPPDPAPRRFHERLGLDPATRVILYQGGFSHGRGVEQLVEVVHRIEGAVLVLLGYGEREAEFRALVEEPRHRGRIFLLPAVPPTELLDWVASADVVGVLFQKDTLNNMLSTPNKFLEAMAAGVPSVVSDHPGMGPIARETGCGIAVPPEDLDAIAGAIRSILDAPDAERLAFRRRALETAHGTYNWETQVAELLATYGQLTGRPW